MRPRSTTSLLVLALLLGACDSATRAPARFPHAPHLTGQGCGGPNQPACPTCVSCHASVRDPKQPDALTPSRCAECHRDAEQAVARSVREAVEPNGLGRAILFSHAEHLQMPEIDGQCVGCHAGVASKTASGASYPPMSSCLQCHQSEFDRGVCTPCHRTADLVRLVPQTFLRHDSGWMAKHGRMAGRNQALCSSCHSQASCADCHDDTQTISTFARNPEKVEAGYVHRGDWLTRHPIEARSQPASCQRCHSSSSCDGCHVKRGVSAARVGANNPHPSGWVGSDTASPSFHGRAAKRDILSCAACHDQGPATNCIRCHRVGGVGGSPHAGGWTSNRSPSAAMCRWCHEP